MGTVLPALARASVIDALLGKATPQYDASSGNLQTMPLLQPAYNLNPAPATGGGDVTVVDNSALVSQEGPAGTLADIVKPANPTISVYVVQPGDTLSGIAKLFDVSTGTILSANDLPRGAVLQPGEQLVILPITGIQYTVKKGDTIESIAKVFGGDVTEIESYNNVDNSSLAVGAQIIIPSGETPGATSPGSGSSSNSTSSGSTKVLQGTAGGCGTLVPLAHNPNEPSHNVGPVGTCAEDAYYIAPLSHYVQTQGIHGYNAVDLAAPMGTPIMASADGAVIVARAGGWNGGYGSYVVIQHGNGSQTLYAHMSKVAAYDGESVVQGQVIGYVGQSGNATGPHVHFEIRNGIRNPF
ncbi:MAG TPA: M23 family metallopeptidase [Candidatus Paceibacterota bacterium]|nr:M23 family metallopeptidase [Candidatus Paceibacterota bacterium]